VVEDSQQLWVLTFFNLFLSVPHAFTQSWPELQYFEQVMMLSVPRSFQRQVQLPHFYFTQRAYSQDP
jgi:hypothetical protein